MLTLSTAEIDITPVRRRVEILAVFGAGKTTLATRLSRSGSRLLAEDHERNPFWGDQASISALGYLGYDLSFLLQHAHLVSSAADGQTSICDWSFATDLLWASLRLGGDLSAYQTIHTTIVRRLGPPAGYLYLRQAPDTIVERLERRSRRTEESFRQYVKTACIHLESLFAQLPADRVLVVDDGIPASAFEQWIGRVSGEVSSD